MAEKRKVLVVEDNEAQRAVLLAVLGRNDRLEVTGARSGTEALELVKANEYAVIVLDMMLPEMDGLTFIDRLREARPDDVSSIIAVTGATESAIPTSIIEGPYGDQVRAVLRKPLDQNQLVDLVTTWAAGIASAD